ncbi:MAG: hypothetical protein AAFY38_04975 [Pseudomonadota bacterium]
MLRTIMIGNAVFVQGTFVKMHADGSMAVQLDGRVYSGKPVQTAA